MTIRVPRYQRQEQVRARPSARLDENVPAEAFGAGVGQAIQGVARVIEDVQREADNQAVTKAQRDLTAAENDLLFNSETGAFTKRGENAFDLPNQVVPQYEAHAARIEGTLKSQRAKQAFREIARERGGLMVRDLNRHENDERDRYYDETEKSSLAASAASAANYAEQPARVARELVAQRYIMDERGRRKGWSPEKLAEEQRINESATHSAVVGSLISRQNFGAASEYLATNSPTMVDSEVESLQRRLLVEEDRVERRREREERDLQDEASKDGDKLLAKGTLNSQWIEENRHRLSAEDYRYFYGKLRGDGESGPRDRLAYADLRERAGQGQDVRQEARELLQAGGIGPSDFDRIIGEVEQQRPGWYKRGSDYISTMAGVSDLNPDPAAAATKATMLDQWADWAEENPKATMQQAKAAYKDIVSANSLVQLNGLPMPKFAVGGRLNLDIDATEDKLGDALAAGLIDQPEFERQAQILERWRKARAPQSNQPSKQQ